MFSVLLSQRLPPVSPMIPQDPLNLTKYVLAFEDMSKPNLKGFL
jgi:hypothetical protein